MSGAGSLFDMIGKLRVNQALRREKRTTYTRVRQMYIDSFAWKNFHEQHHEKIDEATLKKVKERVRTEIRTSIRRENRKRAVVLFVTFVTIILLLVSFYNI
mgnify:CR=1 FL=1